MKNFICDSCGETIICTQGSLLKYIVEWRTVSNIEETGLRLVHKNGKCQYPRNVPQSHRELYMCMGADGLMGLLAMIPFEMCQKSDVISVIRKLHDLDATLLTRLADEIGTENEIIELIKDMHIPNYRKAKPYFQAAISVNIFEPNMPENFYNQSDILATLEYIKTLK